MTAALAPLLATAPRDRDGWPILPTAHVRVTAPNINGRIVEFTGDVVATPTIMRHGVPSVVVEVRPTRPARDHARTVAPETCTVMRRAAQVRR